MLLAMAEPAAAHGEEAFFAPVGQVLALTLTLVIVLALRAKVRWALRASAIVLAVAACLPPYFVTNAYVPYWVAFSGVAWFVVGFVPPLLLSGLLLFWATRGTRRTTP